MCSREEPEPSPPFNQSMQPQTIDIQGLSLEEIENLLSQVSTSLEESRNNKSISEKVNEQFSEEWAKVEKGLTSDFEKSIAKERADFALKESFRIVLHRHLGEYYTKEFFKSVANCVRKKDFSHNQKFYRTLRNDSSNGSSLVQAARAAFAVYKMNLAKSGSADFLKLPKLTKLKEDLREIKRGGDSVVLATIQDFQEVGLLD